MKLPISPRRADASPECVVNDFPPGKLFVAIPVMRVLRYTIPVFLFPLLALSSADGRDVTDSFDVPEGFQVTLWAESPQLFNPTNIDVDERGRVWVTEAVNYRDFRNNQGKDPDVLHHPDGDRVMILEDTNGDGLADSSTVFVQDPDLVSPLGIAVLGDKVVVSSSPHAIVYKRGGERGDEVVNKEILLTGFAGFNHDHGLHSFIGGPDGRLYFNAGNTGPHVVTDSGGWTLRAGSFYNGGSPYNTDNKPGLRSDDGRIWVGGLALRVEPDGSGLTVLGHNFRNAYELAVDSFGNLWQSDNDDTVSNRTTWLMEGGNLGFASADGSRSWRADRRPGQEIRSAHWRQEDPGVIPAGDITGAGAPTGIVYYETGDLGDDYEGMLLSCDAGRNVVFGYFPRERGAGFELERFIFLTSLREAAEDKNYVWNDLSEDRRKWFRPSDIAVGTDGALYISDWYDQVVGGHLMKEEKGYGRIYRVSRAGSEAAVPELELDSVAGQLDALKSPAVNVRYAAAERLREKGAAVLPGLRDLFEAADPYLRARALWLIAAAGRPGQAIVEEALHDSDPRIRVTAFRAIRQTGGADVPRHAGALARDASPAVRREVAIALRDVSFSESRDLLLDLARGYDGNDRWYLDAFGIGADGKEEALYPLLLEEFAGADPLKWDASFADIVWRLHPDAAIDALRARAKAAELDPEARRQAVNALAFIPSRAAALAMVDVALSSSDEAGEKAAWWVKHRGTNDWSSFEVAELLEVPAEEEPSPPVPSVLPAASSSGASSYPPVAELAEIGGEAPRGREVFSRHCVQCHNPGDGGGNIGPDLVEIHTKFDRTELLRALVDANASIALGYESWTITLENGETHFGFLLADGETVVLRDPAGNRRAFPAADVKERKAAERSLMPDAAALGLSAGDLADLATFLLTPNFSD